MRVGAERLQYDVAPFTALGFGLRQFTGFDQALHERLILGYLNRFPLPDYVRTAISNLCEV